MYKNEVHQWAIPGSLRTFAWNALGINFSLSRLWLFIFNTTMLRVLLESYSCLINKSGSRNASYRVRLYTKRVIEWSKIILFANVLGFDVAVGWVGWSRAKSRKRKQQTKLLFNVFVLYFVYKGGWIKYVWFHSNFTPIRKRATHIRSYSSGIET